MIRFLSCGWNGLVDRPAFLHASQREKRERHTHTDGDGTGTETKAETEAEAQLETDSETDRPAFRLQLVKCDEWQLSKLFGRMPACRGLYNF